MEPDEVYAEALEGNRIENAIEETAHCYSSPCSTNGDCCRGLLCLDTGKIIDSFQQNGKLADSPITSSKPPRLFHFRVRRLQHWFFKEKVFTSDSDSPTMKRDERPEPADKAFFVTVLTQYTYSTTRSCYINASLVVEPRSYTATAECAGRTG